MVVSQFKASDTRPVFCKLEVEGCYYLYYCYMLQFLGRMVSQFKAHLHYCYLQQFKVKRCHNLRLLNTKAIYYNLEVEWCNNLRQTPKNYVYGSIDMLLHF